MSDQRSVGVTNQIGNVLAKDRDSRGSLHGEHLALCPWLVVALSGRRLSSRHDTLSLVTSAAETPRIAVVGGGIAGLTVAYDILRAHPECAVTVFESTAEVGGKLRLDTVGDLVLDTGAESMLATRPEAVDLAQSLGLAQDIVTPAVVGANLWIGDSMRRMPRGLLLGIPGDLRELAAAEVLSGVALARLSLDLAMPGTPLDGDVSVGTYVADRLGREVVDRLVDPLLGGVYAGHAYALSMQATMPGLFASLQREPRSLLVAAGALVDAGSRATRPLGSAVFAGLRGGVGRLPVALAAAVTGLGGVIRHSSVVRSLSVVPDGYCLEVGETRASESLTFDRVVLAAPGPASARILRSVAAQAADRISAIDYASVALVTMVYPAENVPRQVTSGFLVPATMGRSIKAATFATNKWEWTREHAGDDVVVIRASLGRAGEEVVLQRDDDELMALAHGDLTAALGISAPPRAWSVTRWGGALAQYTVGHVDLVSAIRSDLAHLPHLALAGAAYDGVGIPAVIASAHAAAAQLTADLAS